MHAQAILYLEWTTCARRCKYENLPGSRFQTIILYGSSRVFGSIIKMRWPWFWKSIKLDRNSGHFLSRCSSIHAMHNIAAAKLSRLKLLSPKKIRRFLQTKTQTSRLGFPLPKRKPKTQKSLEFFFEFVLSFF